MTTFPAHPAWDFVTRLYAAPGVAPACLELQERHGVDAGFMLFCLWRGSVSAKPLGEHMPALTAAAQEWHHAVVLPVRAARRRLKADPATPQSRQAEALYKTVLAAEIDCERAELLMLADLADALYGPPEGGGSAAVMTANLDAFFEASGVAPTAQDQAAAAAVLDAARAGQADGGGFTSPE